MVQIPFSVQNINAIKGLQFSLKYDETVLTYQGIESGGLSLTEVHTNAQKNILHLSWNGDATQHGNLFRLKFTAQNHGNLEVLLSMADRYLAPEIYFQDTSTSHLDLVFEKTSSKENSFHLYQNRPNPFSDNTLIEFELNQAEVVHVYIYDIYGQIIYQYQQILFQRRTTNRLVYFNFPKQWHLLLSGFPTRSFR